MFVELLVATFMVLLTVLIHGVGLFALGRLFRKRVMAPGARQAHLFAPRAFGFSLVIVVGLIVLHGVEIWAYALLYGSIGALPNLREAVYFSTITYSTVGYDDEGIVPAWKLVAAIESVNGIILLGWSTAFFATVMARLARR